MHSHATRLIHHYAMVAALGTGALGLEMLGGNTTHYLAGLLIGLCIGKGLWNFPEPSR